MASLPLSRYRLGLDPYSEGTLGEITGSGLSYSDRGSFSTFDQDNNDYPNVNCAVSNHGAWWYKQNSAVNLNGDWGHQEPAGNQVVQRQSPPLRHLYRDEDEACLMRGHWWWEDSHTASILD